MIEAFLCFIAPALSHPTVCAVEDSFFLRFYLSLFSPPSNVFPYFILLAKFWLAFCVWVFAYFQPTPRFRINSIAFNHSSKASVGFFFGCCLVLEAVKRQSGGEESEKENFDRLLVLKRVKTPGSSERVKVLPISLLFRENRNKVLREE